MNARKAIASAKQQVIASGRSNVHLFVCRDYDGGFEILGNSEYQEYGDENRCVAAVWSYADGEYDEANNFHENGKIAAAVETY